MKKKIVNRKGVVEVVKGEEEKQYSRKKKTLLPVRRSFLGTRIFYNCPKCGRVLTFEHKKHRDECSHCGQKLEWSGIQDICGVYLQINDADEAFYWAGQYEYYNGTTYDLELDKWRLIYRSFPMIMFYPFPEGKAYGRFMRKASKEATIITYF